MRKEWLEALKWKEMKFQSQKMDFEFEFEKRKWILEMELNLDFWSLEWIRDNPNGIEMNSRNLDMICKGIFRFEIWKMELESRIWKLDLRILNILGSENSNPRWIWVLDLKMDLKSEIWDPDVEIGFWILRMDLDLKSEIQNVELNSRSYKWNRIWSLEIQCESWILDPKEEILDLKSKIQCRFGLWILRWNWILNLGSNVELDSGP